MIFHFSVRKDEYFTEIRERENAWHIKKMFAAIFLFCYVLLLEIVSLTCCSLMSLTAAMTEFKSNVNDRLLSLLTQKS